MEERTWQVLKASPEAARCDGHGSLAWPLLGRWNRDASTTALRAPAENVALEAYSQERELLKEAFEEAKKGDDS